MTFAGRCEAPALLVQNRYMNARADRAPPDELDPVLDALSRLGGRLESVAVKTSVSPRRLAIAASGEAALHLVRVMAPIVREVVVIVPGSQLELVVFESARSRSATA